MGDGIKSEQQRKRQAEASHAYARGTGGVSDYDKGMKHALGGSGKANPADAHKYAKGTGGVSDYNAGMKHAYGVGKLNPADAHKYAQGTGGVSDYNTGMSHAFGVGKLNPADAHKYSQGTGGVSDYKAGMKHAYGVGKPNPSDAHKYAQGTGGVSDYNTGMQHALGGSKKTDNPNATSEENDSRRDYYNEQIKRAADEYLNEYGGRDDAETKEAFADYSKKVDGLVTQRDAYNRAMMSVDTAAVQGGGGTKAVSLSADGAQPMYTGLDDEENAGVSDSYYEGMLHAYGNWSSEVDDEEDIASEIPDEDDSFGDSFAVPSENDNDILSNPLYQSVFENSLSNVEDVIHDVVRPTGWFAEQIEQRLGQQQEEQQQGRQGLTNEELLLCGNNPLSAVAVGENRALAIDYARQMFGGAIPDGEMSNAYLHAMFTALNTIGIGNDLALGFANAHENIPDNAQGNREGTNIPNIDFMEMDLHNNALGIAIAQTMLADSPSGFVNYDELAETVFNIVITQGYGTWVIEEE